MRCVGIPKEETGSKDGDTARKIEIVATGQHGGFARIPFFGNTVRGSLIGGGICLRRENKPISSGYTKSRRLR